MKPAAFEYHPTRTVAETTALLAELGGEGRILAGGQSLVPLMNFRLAQPPHVVDINGVAELAYIRPSGDRVAIGALARQAQVERSEHVQRDVPLLAEALKWVAHPPIRHRGTVVGSIAHADPAAELPAVALALDAQMMITSASGSRAVPAEEFFVGPFETVVGPGDLVTEVIFPTVPRTGHAFAEFARRHGDFAIAGAAVTITLDGDKIGDARVVLCGIGPQPLRAHGAEEKLREAVPDEGVVAAAADAAGEGLQPSADIHGSSAYRVRVAQAQVRSAISTAVKRARVA